MCFIPLFLVFAMPTFGSSAVDLTAAPINRQPVKPPPPEKKVPTIPMYAILSPGIRIEDDKEDDKNKSKNKPAKH